MQINVSKIMESDMNIKRSYSPRTPATLRKPMWCHHRDVRQMYVYALFELPHIVASWENGEKELIPQFAYVRR